MTKTRVIRVFSFILAMTLVFAMFSSQAFAMDQRQFSAWIASALTAINITWNSTVAPVVKFLDFLDTPFQITDNSFNYIPYTHERDDEILSRSTLSIDGNKVTIDGKEYYDIWLSHDAADKFRVNAFDLENAFDIASESEGTFVSGAGFLNGEPMYNVNGVLRTPSITGEETIFGGYQVTFPIVANRVKAYVGNWLSPNGSPENYHYLSHYFDFKNNNTMIYWTCNLDANRFTQSAFLPDNMFRFNNTPFDFDWTSSVIPGTPLELNDGLHMLVPANPNDWSSDPQAQQTINNINNYFELNPDLSPGVDVDLNTPGIIDKLDDLLDIISTIINLTRPSFGPKDDPGPVDPISPDPIPEPYPDPEPEPYPDPDPQPGTPLPDIDWKTLFDVLKNIFQKLSNIDVTSQNIANHIVELRNRFEEWFDSIRESINDIADKIVHGNKDWFQDIVDSIWNPLLNLFTVFKSHIGIWHYVVDWLSRISAPFTFFYGVLQGLGILYMSPIYACFAGILVIAIYRRFGR